ncbi:hypothetical protein BDZ89DRAFT_1060765 [Hymenopellis radicata]|nr:hypothetical protein BDZ89DRAFT_1060765 [Hymenopellis radicata]
MYYTLLAHRNTLALWASAQIAFASIIIAARNSAQKPSKSIVASSPLRSRWDELTARSLSRYFEVIP